MTEQAQAHRERPLPDIPFAPLGDRQSFWWPWCWAAIAALVMVVQAVAQPPAESLLGRTPVPPAVGTTPDRNLNVSRLATDFGESFRRELRADAVAGTDGNTFTATCRVTQEETFDFHGVQYFAIACGPTQGRSVLSIDGDLPLAAYLRQHRGERLAVSIGGSK